MQTIEKTILANLIHNEQYTRKVLPFIKGDYFSDRTERTVFEEIQKFVDKYNDLPNQNALEVELDSRKDLNEDDYKRVLSVVKELQKDDNVIFDWLVQTTEDFCKDKAVYNAIVDGIAIIDGKDKNEVSMLYLQFLQTPLLLVLITVLVMIIYTILMPGMNSIIR